MTPVVPNSSEPIADRQGNVTQTWLRFFNAIIGEPEAIVDITVGASPFSRKVSKRGFVSIVGGTVSAVTLTRSRKTITVSAGNIPVMNGDTIEITYSAAPTVSFIPS